MSNLRIVKKYIGEDQVDGTKIRLGNAEALKADNMAGSATGLLKLTVNDLLEFPQALRPQLSSYVAPESDAELAPKKFVDDSVATEVTARELAMSNEISARTAAVSDEVSARELAMENEISARTAAVSAEESARQLAMENEISARTAAVSAEESARQLAMSNEISVRAAADLGLSDRLDTIEGSGGALGVGFTPAEITDWEVGVDTVKEALDQVGADMTTAEGEIVGLRSDLDDEVSARELAMSNEISARTAAVSAEESARQLAMSNEISARTAAVSAEESARQLAMSNEISARTAAVSAEESARQLAMENEISVRAAADLGLSDRLDTIEGSDTGSIKKAVADLAGAAPGLLEALGQLSNALVDDDVSTGLLNVLAYEVSARQLAMENEISARMAAGSTEESARQLAMENEISARTAAVSAEESARQLAMENEISARTAAVSAEESARQLAMSNEISARTAAVSAEESARQLAMSNEISARTAAVSAEESARQLAMSNEISARTAAVSAEESARQLAMSNEISARTAAVSDEVSARELAMENEISVRAAADLGLSDRLDALETGDYSFVKEAFTLNNAGLTNVTLAHLITDNSLAVFVGRLALHVGVDYTLSIVDDLTVITWIGSVAVGGDEALDVGDKVYVTYAHI